MYVCIYMCVYIYIYVRVYMHTCTYAHMHMHVSACICMYMYLHKNLQILYNTLHKSYIYSTFECIKAPLYRRLMKLRAGLWFFVLPRAYLRPQARPKSRSNWTMSETHTHIYIYTYIYIFCNYNLTCFVSLTDTLNKVKNPSRTETNPKHWPTLDKISANPN